MKLVKAEPVILKTVIPFKGERIMISKERMQAYAEANEQLISVKKQAPNTTVLKYKNKVFYKNLWTPELCELRGTVVDDNFDIVQRPFTKIFNMGEKKAPKIADSDAVSAVVKINGFMAAATIRDGELFISTTGSIASDFSDLARNHIEKLNWHIMDPELTYIFEICDETDPHVVPEKIGAYLLGARRKVWDSEQHTLDEEVLDMVGQSLGCYRPEHFWYKTFAEAKQVVRKVKHEGFVMWTGDGREIKIKSPYYLTTKFFGRKTEARLESLLDDPESTKQMIDEEYYDVIDHLAINKSVFLALNEQERFTYLREYFDNFLG